MAPNLFLITSLVTTSTTSSPASTTTTATTELTTTTTEPATAETATTETTEAATETEAATTTAAITPAAIKSSNATADEGYYGCGKGHWDNEEEMRQNNTCRFLCNCGFEKNSNGEDTSVPLECNPTNGQCTNNVCPDGFEGMYPASVTGQHQ